MNVIAIDPGVSGGIAWTFSSSVGSVKMPGTEGDLLNKLRELRASGIEVAYIEEVGGFCGQGQPGSSMFKFGRGFGFTLGALMALGFRVELVRPQKWQKALALGTKNGAGGKTEWKNKLKACAQRLYPSEDVTLNTADALLILEYAIRDTLPR